MRERCRRKTTFLKFPQSIQDFGNLFVAMQEERHSADYDPFSRFQKSDVMVDVVAAEQAIASYYGASIKDRRAFAAYVLLKQRTD